MARKSFGFMINKMRTNNKLTMEDLANSVGVKKSTVSMWENGGIVPREDVLIKLSQLFQVSVDYLLGNDMEGMYPENKKLKYIQRNLEKLNDEKLEKAEDILKAVFDDLFEDDEDYGDL